MIAFQQFFALMAWFDHDIDLGRHCLATGGIMMRQQDRYHVPEMLDGLELRWECPCHNL
jgi:hypothetical protein